MAVMAKMLKHTVEEHVKHTVVVLASRKDLGDFSN